MCELTCVAACRGVGKEGEVELSAFRRAILSYGFSASDEEIETVFDLLDDDSSGALSLQVCSCEWEHALDGSWNA